MTRKKDWFYDTKAGRIILLVMAILLVLLGVVLIALFFCCKWWYLLVMGIIILFSGICNLIILERLRKERNRSGV